MSEALSVDNRVSLRIIETTPAVVKFNYEEMEANLDAVLVKYQGLTFTDSDAAECKKTIAELRKGQKALSDFRIKTKKELTESVTDFEKQCKKLHDKFETVISPLTIQNDQFELDRREKKRAEIQTYIPLLVRDQGLDEKYSAQIVILEEYYNKGKTLKEIKKELYSIATSLKVQQDKEAQDIDLVKTKVQLANAQYQLTPPRDLKPEQYLRLLDFYPISRIEESITFDAQEAKKTYDAFDAIPEAVEMPKAIEVIHQELRHKGFVEELAIGYQGECASAPIGNKTVMTAVYEVTGTEEQLTALEAYLDANNYSWIDRPNE